MFIGAIAIVIGLVTILVIFGTYFELVERLEALHEAVRRLETWAMRCDPDKGTTLILNGLAEQGKEIRALHTRVSFNSRPKP